MSHYPLSIHQSRVTNWIYAGHPCTYTGKSYDRHPGILDLDSCTGGWEVETHPEFCSVIIMIIVGFIRSSHSHVVPIQVVV